MLSRRLLSVAILTACAAIPVIIGASCPPPTNPAYFSLTTCNVNTGQVFTPLPACTPGLVCIEFVNSTGVQVQVALFYDSGFNNISPESRFDCCSNPNSTVACPCNCAGFETGDCRLNRVQLFVPANLKTISGQRVFILAPGQRVTEKVNSQAIKSIGVAVARDTTPDIVLTTPTFEDGPVYRRRIVPPPDPPGKDFVGDGETVRFVVFDINETSACTGETDLVSIAVRHETPGSTTGA